MKYTKYFSRLIKQYGTPQLPSDKLGIFLNIIHLEAKKQVYSDLNVTNRFIIHIRTIDDKLDNLTGKLEPQELINRWQNGQSIKSYKNQEENTTWDENDEYFYPKKKL